MVVVGVAVSVIDPFFKNEKKSLFAGGDSAPVYDATKARRVRSIESVAFDPRAPPADINALFPGGGWIDLIGENSHFVLGEIKLPLGGRFRIENSKHTRVVLVELMADGAVVASHQIDLGDVVHSEVRRGNLKLGRCMDGAPFPLWFLFHESSVRVQDDIDMSRARRTVSAVALPTTSNKYKGSVPPPVRLMDVDTIAFAITESSLPEIVKLIN